MILIILCGIGVKRQMKYLSEHILTQNAINELSEKLLVRYNNGEYCSKIIKSVIKDIFKKVMYTEFAILALNEFLLKLQNDNKLQIKFKTEFKHKHTKIISRLKTSKQRSYFFLESLHKIIELI